MKILFNIGSRFNIENIYIQELHIKLISNVISTFIYHIENLM